MTEKSRPFPCEVDDQCPYDYSQHPDRDIEGMPLLENDPRGCPSFGHVCPVFMEECDLTVEELNIRAIIHCFLLLARMDVADLSKPEFAPLIESYPDVIRQYPPSAYPQYYDRM
jgi:hypothetical protein